MRAVVFDMDGVIFDSEKICLNCWLYQAEKYGLEDIEEVVHQCIGTNKAKTKEIVTNRYGNLFDYDKVCEENSQMYHDYVVEHGLPMKPGVVEILDYLKNKGYKIGMASSTRVALVEAQLVTAGIREYFDEVVGGDLLKRSKPAPDIYLMACERLEIAPEEAYAIEDSYNGIRSAYDAGMKPIMVPDMLSPTDEMREKSVMVKESLLELVGII